MLFDRGVIIKWMDDNMPVEATFESLARVGSLCIGQTWFVALLMALKFPSYRVAVFWACFLALVTHVAIAGVAAVAVSQLMVYLALGEVVVYLIAAYLFYRDYQKANPDSDMIAEAKSKQYYSAGDLEADYGAAAKSTQGPRKKLLDERLICGDLHQSKVIRVIDARSAKIFMACFMAMFLAEWGDRTQIAMLGAAASMPVIAVSVGSIVAFFVLTLSAVVVACFIIEKFGEVWTISEKLVYLVSALSFVVFAALSLHDGLVELKIVKWK